MEMQLICVVTTDAPEAHKRFLERRGQLRKLRFFLFIYCWHYWGGGLGLVLASAGFGMLTAPIMELHNQKGFFLHHIIFACCTLICIICILLLPETRNRPLPETLLDGESYTRQPLLPPRKPGDPLLTKSESREYARVCDTPLHEAAATAISTMDSTASSAVDLHMLIDAPVQQETGQLFCMNTLTASQEQDEVKQTVEEHPKSPASSVEDPLLGTIPNTSTPVNSVPKSKTTESPPDDVLAVLSSPLIIDPAPSFLDSPNEVDSPPPIDVPLCAANQSDPGQSPILLLNDIPSSSSIDSPVHPVSDMLPPSPTELSTPPILDPSSQANAFQASPIDSGIPLLHLDTPPVMMNSIESGPPSPGALPTFSNGTSHATSIDSVTESGNPPMANSTVSSPIDSGLLSDTDLPNAPNGEASS